VSAAQEAHLAGAAASYRGLFAEPWARWLALADVCARLPQGMVSITLLLVAAQHASMRVAGLVLAGYTLAQAASGPRRGRLADRHGLGPAAALCTLGYTLAPLGLLSAASAGLLTGTAVAAGLLNPPLSPGMRSLWSTNAGARFKQTAFALDAAVFDLAYITGPVLASALATGVAPAAAVVLLLMLTGAAVITIAAPARGSASAISAPARGCLVLGAQALTSSQGHDRPQNRLVRLPTGYACGLAVLTAAALYPPLLAVAAPLAGLCLGPTLATLFGAAAAAAPHGRGTETQAWVNSIMNGGAAAGAAIAAFAAARPILALGLASALAAVATLSAVHGPLGRG